MLIVWNLQLLCKNQMEAMCRNSTGPISHPTKRPAILPIDEEMCGEKKAYQSTNRHPLEHASTALLSRATLDHIVIVCLLGVRMSGSCCIKSVA